METIVQKYGLTPFMLRTVPSSAKGRRFELPPYHRAFGSPRSDTRFCNTPFSIKTYLVTTRKDCLELLTQGLSKTTLNMDFT